MAAEVDGKAEAEAMLNQHGVLPMTTAERKLARWPNTHVLAPELVSFKHRVVGRWSSRFLSLSAAAAAAKLVLRL